MTVSVNLSPLQIFHRDLPAIVRQVLADTGLPPPHRLELELTEAALINDTFRAFAVLDRSDNWA